MGDEVASAVAVKLPVPLVTVVVTLAAAVVVAAVVAAAAECTQHVWWCVSQSLC